MYGEEYIKADKHGPDHYKGLPIEPWSIMEANFSEEQFEGFLRGNVLKYILRYPAKGGVSDLKKAAHYLERLIELTELERVEM